MIKILISLIFFLTIINENCNDYISESKYVWLFLGKHTIKIKKNKKLAQTSKRMRHGNGKWKGTWFNFSR